MLLKIAGKIEVETKELPDQLYTEALRVGIEVLLSTGEIKLADNRLVAASSLEAMSMKIIRDTITKQGGIPAEFEAKDLRQAADQLLRENRAEIEAEVAKSKE